MMREAANDCRSRAQLGDVSLGAPGSERLSTIVGRSREHMRRCIVTNTPYRSRRSP